MNAGLYRENLYVDNYIKFYYQLEIKIMILIIQHQPIQLKDM